MLPTPPITLAVWTTGIALLAFMTFMLVKRGLVREFPIFTAYVVFHLLQAAIGLWVAKHFTMLIYYYYGFTSDALDGPLSLALIYEIFSKALSPYPGLRKSGLTLYCGAMVVLAAIGFFMLRANSYTEIQLFAVGILAMNRSLEFIRIGLLLLLFVFHRVFGLSWRHYLYGIALGLGTSATITAVSTTLRMQIGRSWNRFFLFLPPLAYDIGLVIWSYYLATSESKLQVTEAPYSASLSRWNAALEEILAR